MIPFSSTITNKLQSSVAVAGWRMKNYAVASCDNSVKIEGVFPIEPGIILGVDCELRSK